MTAALAILGGNRRISEVDAQMAVFLHGDDGTKKRQPDEEDAARVLRSR